jgi:hypothetical protein
VVRFHLGIEKDLIPTGSSHSSGTQVDNRRVVPAFVRIFDSYPPWSLKPFWRTLDTDVTAGIDEKILDAMAREHFGGPVGYKPFCDTVEGRGHAR